MREEYSEPALSGIQVLQKDGTAVITVSKDNDDCDQAWTDIAVAREKRATTKPTPSMWELCLPCSSAISRL
jgi:hypothetical protein